MREGSDLSSSWGHSPATEPLRHSVPWIPLQYRLGQEHPQV